MQTDTTALPFSHDAKWIVEHAHEITSPVLEAAFHARNRLVVRIETGNAKRPWRGRFIRKAWARLEATGLRSR